ncbi:MAG: hypothetical protein FHK82_08635 [Sedimenticola thiotaurini]|uniref:Uncharacterized protein n=1 Tax=Sedimenticola thiotaurini TaxID=1543721 RepID=A0A558D301_9GAMM|nr:MAG: hypothetical protein FHK82_08635 [Sedimenticola thiotaurini]
MSHVEHEYHETTYATVRTIANELNNPIAILPISAGQRFVPVCSRTDR